MRILYHHRTLGDGAEGIHIREMVKAFRDLGHEVKVVGPIGEASPESSRKSRILGGLKRSIPNILYEFLEIAYTGYSFLRIAWEIRQFKPDFIYERYITFNAGTVLAVKIFHVPVCLEVNAPLALERGSEHDERLSLRKVASWMERWICANATWTVVVSTPLREYLESIGVPCGKCIVMPNGVDPDRFTPKEKGTALLDTLGIPTGCFIVGFTGVLRSWHGLDLLVRAVGYMVSNGFEAFLLVVGDGPYRESLEILVNELGLERCVCITGRIPHDRVPHYIALFDVAVSPRATFYASPMKVIEYMALAKPVVVPHTRNLLDIIDEGLNGLTFEDENPIAMAKALISLYKSPELCEQIGLNARDKVEKRLNWKWNAEVVCRFFSA